MTKREKELLNEKSISIEELKKAAEEKEIQERLEEKSNYKKTKEEQRQLYNNAIKKRYFEFIKNDDYIAELRHKYIKVLLGGKFVVAEKLNISKVCSLKDFKDYVDSDNRSKYIEVYDEVYKAISTKTTGYVFLNMRDDNNRFLISCYDDIKFCPSKIYHTKYDVNYKYDFLITNYSLIDSPKTYNLFQGYPYSLQNILCSCKDKHQSFLDHTFNVICNKNQVEYDYLIKWMAHGLQNSDKKVPISIVIKGAQGTGKSFFVKAYGQLFGKYFHTIKSIETLSSRFNGELANKLLVFADEANVWGGKHETANIIKSFISEPTFNVEYKGKDSISIDNHARLIIVSNHEHIINMEDSDRRFLILEVSKEHKNDSTYFNNLKNDLEKSGYESLMDYLYNLDISDWDYTKLPKSAAKDEQKLQSFSSKDQWLYTAICNINDTSYIYIPWGYYSNIMENVERVFVSDLYDRYLKYINDVAKTPYRESQTAITKMFTKILGTPKRVHRGYYFEFDKDFIKKYIAEKELNEDHFEHLYEDRDEN